MIDAAAEALARRILVVFPASTARTRADVKRIQVPVGRLLGAVLDRQADRIAALPDTDWMDRRHPDLPAAAGAWRSVVRQCAQFPPEAWEEHVAQASRLALSHLVRPAETAAADAFADGPERLPVPAALARVRVFGAYGYLPEIAARYAERKGIAELDRAGLERLLRRIDRRMVEDFGPDEWVALAGPLYDLVGPIASPPGAVGTGLLRALFEAKGRDDLARTLVADAYSRDALRARLADVILTSPTTLAEDSMTASAPAPVVPSTDAAPDVVPAEPEPAVSSVEPADGDRRGVTGAAPTHIADVEPSAVETPDGPATPPEVPFEPELPHAPELDTLPETPPADDEPQPHLSADTGDTIGSGSALDGIGSGPDVSGWADPVPTAETVEPIEVTPLPTIEPDTDEVAPLPAVEPNIDEPAAPETAPASLEQPTTPADAPPPAAAPADVEPLWKQMLRPAPGEPTAPPVGNASTTDIALPAIAPVGAPKPALPPADDEPLWRRFAVPETEPLPEDDEDGWAVAPTLAAVPDVPPAPLPPTAPRTLADTFAAPEPAPLAETAAVAPAAQDLPDAKPGDSDEAPALDAPEVAAPPHPLASLDALEQAVLGTGDPERREWFVNALFGGSPADYHTTLQRLAAAPSWTAATEIIASEIFRKHRVNIYSDASLAFTDAVEARMDART